MGKSGEIPALFRSGHGVPERISPNAIQIRPPALGVHLSYIEGRLAQRHGELEPSCLVLTVIRPGPRLGGFYVRRPGLLARTAEP